jgi:hypothetical protein
LILTDIGGLNEMSDVTRFFTKEVSDVNRTYLPDCDNKWYVDIKALNVRQRRERDSMAIREKRFIPKDARTAAQFKARDVEETAVEYQIAQVRDFEYDNCVVDFVLPYMPKGSDSPVDFKKKERTRDEVKIFLDNIPAQLADFIDEAIAKANKEGKFAEDGENLKED